MSRTSKVKIAIVLFLLFLLYYFLNQRYSFSIPCLFHEITGLYCPGCGITRLLFSLLQLDFLNAFKSNPLIFVLIVLYMGYLLLKIVLKITKNKEITIPNYVYYILLVIVILFGVVRNILGFEFLTP